MLCRHAHAEKAPFACRLLVEKKNYTLGRARTLTPEVRCIYVELQSPRKCGLRCRRNYISQNPSFRSCGAYRLRNSWKLTACCG